MAAAKATRLDRALAKVCLACPFCRQARAKGKGFAYGVVAKVEHRICPFCQAYQRVYGRPAFEPPNRSQ